MTSTFCLNGSLPWHPGRVLRIVFFVTALGALSPRSRAQELPVFDKAYHAGEQLHVINIFAAPVDITGGGVTFNLEKLDDESQRLWTRSFNLTQLNRLKPNEYEASGEIPIYAASGVYRLVRAWSGVSDLFKAYDYPDTLHQNITIKVINERKDPLPPLLDLKLLR
jgi:hypothetical protein